MKDLTIGEAAGQAGVGVETIRFYERRGLIEQPPKPLGVGFRVYSPEQVQIRPSGPADRLLAARDPGAAVVAG